LRPETVVPLADEAGVGLVLVDESEAVALALRIQAAIFVRAIELAFGAVVVVFAPVVTAKAKTTEEDVRPVRWPGWDRSQSAVVRLILGRWADS